MWNYKIIISYRYTTIFYIVICIYYLLQYKYYINVWANQYQKTEFTILDDKFIFLYFPNLNFIYFITHIRNIVLVISDWRTRKLSMLLYNNIIYAITVSPLFYYLDYVLQSLLYDCQYYHRHFHYFFKGL